MTTLRGERPVSSTTGHRWPCTRFYDTASERDACTCDERDALAAHLMRVGNVDWDAVDALNVADQVLAFITERDARARRGVSALVASIARVTPCACSAQRARADAAEAKLREVNEEHDREVAARALDDAAISMAHPGGLFGMFIGDPDVDDFATELRRRRLVAKWLRDRSAFTMNRTSPR